jgi:N6-adenosine-specific RNA methylase IME4
MNALATIRGVVRSAEREDLMRRTYPTLVRRVKRGERYDVVYVDPPWSYYGPGDKWAAAGKHYRLLDAAHIEAAPVPELLSDRGVVFLWTTSAFLEAAVELGRAWRLHYRGVAFVWVKTGADGKPIGAKGVRPSIVKPTTEFVLAFSRVEKGRPMPLGSEAVPQTWLGRVLAHSHKPEAVALRIESLYPRAKRIELFARRRRDGWVCDGDQLPSVRKSKST